MTGIMKAREHLHAIRLMGDQGPTGYALRYLLAREAEREATPPSAGDGDEFRHFVPYGSTSAPCGYESGLDHRGKPLTDERRLTTCGACQDRMTGWKDGERPLAVTPPPAPVEHPIPDACPHCGGPVESISMDDTPVGKGWYRCANRKPLSACRSLAVHKAPAPVDEAAVEALARVVVEHTVVDTDDWRVGTALRDALDRGEVPGYGPTGASVGAGEDR